jgi:predicted nucleic acid-binding protein
MRRALLALLLAATPAAAQAPWPEAFTNPRPAPGDLLLPLPCGAALAFRPVATPAGAGPLDDRAVTLGSADADLGYAEFLRGEAVAGAFTEGGRRVFWLQKYETTRDQFAAVMEPQCPTPSEAGRAPMTNVSWFEATAFASRATTHILREARARMPAADGAPGFLRLPTEAEWEYAARGGAALPEVDFAGRLPPLPEGLGRRAWFQGPRSAGGRAQPVGGLEPDALGLHDMLGNAAEWVLEPFRLNRVGRLHGQAGGFIAKGGDFRTPEAALRSSLRLEIPPHDASTGEPTRLPSIGFRLAIAAPATTSLPRAEAIARAFEAESRARDAAAEAPRGLIDILRRDAADPRLRDGLDRLEASLRTAERARAEEERARLAAQLEAAAVIGRSVWLAQRRMDGLQQLVDTADVMRASPEMRGSWVRLLEGIRAERELSLDGTARIVAEIGRAAEPARVRAVGQVVAGELMARGLEELVPFLEVAIAQAAAMRERGLPARDALREEVLAAGRRIGEGTPDEIVRDGALARAFGDALDIVAHDGRWFVSLRA